MLAKIAHQRLRHGDGLMVNERLAQTSAKRKATAEGKYKKPVFVHLLERKLMAIYSSLLFPA